MSNAVCFDAQTLRDYLLGKLPDEQSDLINSHLNECGTCEATVAGLDSALDTLTSGLKAPAPVAVPQSSGTANQEPELAVALERVKALEASGSSRSVKQGPAASKSSPEQPPVILRDYRLLEPIGVGGMGTVFKAVHTRLDRLVAVKLLPARRLGDGQAVIRFQREMRVIGQLSHSAIVQATDAGEVDGTHFLVMEYVEGMDLNRVCRLCGQLSVANACEIARQAALGLEYAHQQGVVHRDIKPSNLMLSVLGTSQVSVKLLDLGLALLSGVQAPVDDLTTVGQLMGTLDYMAPEQFEDSHQVDVRADIYSLAATLYRLLTGVPPHGSHPKDSPLKKLKILATEVPQPIRQRRPELPLELGELIDRALCQKVEARFSSMNEFAEKLAPWCAAHNLSALWQQASAARATALSFAETLDRSSLPEPRTAAILAASPPPTAQQLAVADYPAHAMQPAWNNPSPPRSGGMRITLALFSLILFAALGVVITITTNNGELVVESLKDGVEVRLKKSGKVVEQMEVTHGSYKTRVTAGEYELELISDADSLQIDRSKFELKRGDTVVARITERPKASTTPLATTEPSAATAAVEVKRPVQLVDLKAAGMDSFEETNVGLAKELKIRAALEKTTDINFEETPLSEALLFLSEVSGVDIVADKVRLTDEAVPLDSPISLKLTAVPISTALHFTADAIQFTWTIDDQRVVLTTHHEVTERRLVTRFYPVGRILPGIRYTYDLNQAQTAEALKNIPLGGMGGGFGGGGMGGMGGGGGYFSVKDGVSLLTTSAKLCPASLTQFGGGGFGGSAGGFGIMPSPSVEQVFLQMLIWSHVNGWEAQGDGNGTLKLLNNVLIIRQSLAAHWQIESLLKAIEAGFAKPLAQPVSLNTFEDPQPQTAHIMQNLDNHIDVNFMEAPLKDVTEYLSGVLECNVLIDQRRLQETGITHDAPVTVQLKATSAHVALRAILEPLGLDSFVNQGVLVITSKDVVNERLVPKIYDARSFVARKVKSAVLMSAIMEETSGQWQLDGSGSGTYGALAETLIVISQTPQVHQEIEHLFQTLDRVLDQGAIKTQSNQH